MTIPGIGKDFHWWHAVTGVSGVALTACIARDWPNGATIAAGFAAVGIGQWINHPVRAAILPDRTVIRKYPWKRGSLGLVAIIGGVVTALLGVIRAFF